MSTKSVHCSDCKYFYYDRTPMSAYFGCDKHYWSTPDYETDFRYAMRKALTCDDFKHVTLNELEPGLLSSDIGKPISSPASPIDRRMAEAFKTNLDLKRTLKNGSKKEGR